MRSADIAGGPIRAAGIVELEANAGGVVLHRMPAWARTRHNDPAHPGPTRTVDGTCTVTERPDALAVGALTLDRIRQLEREVVAARQVTDPNLHLLEGPELFGPHDLADLPDGLHPNAAGYRRMGERFFERAFSPGGPFSL